MWRLFVSVGILITLTGCGGGPPPLPQSAHLLPSTATETSANATSLEAVPTAAEAAAAKVVVPPTAAADSVPAAALSVAAPDATSVATASAVAEVRSLDIAACEQLWGEVAQTLGVDVQKTTAPFQYDGVGNGTSCRLVATGNGTQFKPFVDAANDLRTLLAARDWSEDQAFAADGPTGTVSVYRRGNALALVSVGWQPAHGVNCAGPIAECAIPPEQQNVTVSLDLVETGS